MSESSADAFFKAQLPHLIEDLQHSNLATHTHNIVHHIQNKLREPIHGDLHKWAQAIEKTKLFLPTEIDLKTQVKVGTASDTENIDQQAWIEDLRQLHPWRKGPFDLFGTLIDTEWRSDWKWDRLLPHISPLKNRIVLDIGCGSGYHLWRMVGEGVRLALGIEPMWLYVAQFYLIKQWIDKILSNRAYVLPLTLEEFPQTNLAFDTIFSMGVLYHRKDPISHLQHIKAMLRPQGEMVLETLVIEGDQNTCLIPEDRYCRMRNVWFLPSSAALVHWCKRVGFQNIRIANECNTSLDEQRKTDWMWYDSLQDCLDSKNQQLTIEGLPAPKRVIIIANAP